MRLSIIFLLLFLPILTDGHFNLFQWPPPQLPLFGNLFPRMPPPPPNIFAGLKLPNLLPPPPPPPFIPPPPPPPPPTPPPTTPATTTSPSTVASLVQTGFPTLLPESTTAPIIAELIDERGINSEISEKTIQIGSNGAIDGVIEAGNKPKKKKKKGVLKPPTMPGIAVDELVELEPEDTNFGIQRPPLDPPMLPSISETQHINVAIQGPPNINAAIQRPPPDPPMLPSISEAEQQKFSIPDSAAAVQNGQATIPAQREEAGDGHGSWKIRPSGYKSEGIEVNARDGEADLTRSNTTTFNVIERRNQVIPSSIKHGNEFNNNNAGENLEISRPHERPFLPASSMTKANTTLIPTLSSSQCNIQPDFLPCVSTEKAGLKLFECCKRILMPQGCMELCRYDITQTEIRRQFDQGKCSLLHIGPFLECASDGNNNMECCKHRKIAQKSGPQCEAFCNPSHGIGALGLQHIACQNVVGDILSCHHSGVRPF